MAKIDVTYTAKLTTQRYAALLTQYILGITTDNVCKAANSLTHWFLLYLERPLQNPRGRHRAPRAPFAKLCVPAYRRAGRAGPFIVEGACALAAQGPLEPRRATSSHVEVLFCHSVSSLP